MLKTIVVLPANISFKVKPNETILDAAIRQHIDFPHRCQEGVCAACVCKLVKGQVIYAPDISSHSDQSEHSEYVYCCLAEPQGDVTISHPFIK
ncbi:2Fe-2S iron-sulfur cluster-binding protein [Flocculibacter collagenilyticus]|uniref:2Fe-2S iron-sulfur cluster-binding protein n=1 Tax=Flocculibacter collagenilyticus TaxID=2744479 RepID=UPI0018F50453|nr:2Fe-2S iron-sulfur cluster-binding protein [Flocculibacter collagenilyticus]